MANEAGPGPKLIGVNLDRYTDAAEHELGDIYVGRNGKVFRYVRFLDAVTYVAGHVCTRGTTGTNVWNVTNDRVGGSSVAGLEVVGVLHGTNTVPAQNQYGWIQVAGECAPGGTYAAGDYVIPHATVDGTAVVSGYTAAKADFNIFGKALSATRVKLYGVY